MSYPTCGRGQCSTAQTFCNLNMETVGNIDELRSNINFNDNDQINAVDWNAIKTKLQAIYNFGALGTRNPSQNDINTFINATQNITTITLDGYNTIYDIIDKTSNKLNADLVHTIEDTIDSTLNNAINSYKLNSSRCDMCNASCNTVCQASCQECNVSCISQCYDCGQSGCSCAPSVSGCIIAGNSYGPLGMVC